MSTLKVIVYCLLVFTLESYASTLDQVLRDGHLTIETRVSPETGLTPFQPVTLEVEVATNRWFSRGTRIKDFEIDGSVVYLASKNSTNSTRRMGGTTWSVQSWEISFYPQRAGPIIIPPIELFISVNAENNQTIEGELTLPSIKVDISVLEAMSDVKDWLAATDLSLTEHYQGLKENYRAGDAITRTLRIKAESFPAMMLPVLPFDPIEGLASYQTQAKIYEQSNRGQLVGHREQTIIYTIEKDGQYTLPAYEIDWWNINTQQHEVIQLPAYELRAGNGLSRQREGLEDTNGVSPWMLWLAGIVIAAISLFVLFSIFRPRFVKWRELTDRRTQFLHAANTGDGALAVQYLYSLLSENPALKNYSTLASACQSDEECATLLKQLQAYSFSGNADTMLSPSQAVTLFNFYARREQRKRLWQQSIALTLNTHPHR